MNDGEFIEDLKASPYYERLFRGHKVIQIYIGGSRCINAVDDRSDYDLIILTADSTSDRYTQECLMYKDRKVHWYYISVYEILLDKDKPWTARIYGQILRLKAKNQVVIYENEKYLNLLNLFDEFGDRLLWADYYLTYDSMKKLADGIVSENEIKEKNHTKLIYYLCTASYYALGEELDIQFLQSIKRIKWNPVSDEYKQLAVERIKKFKEYIELNYNDKSVQGEIEKLNNEWTNRVDLILNYIK